MSPDPLTQTLLAEIERIPLIDPHSHIDPHRPVSRHLDDILGYHYYTELAHSAGMSQELLRPEVPPRELERATGTDVGSPERLRQALGKLFEHFTGRGAKACAISLPPDFHPTRPLTDRGPQFIFWALAELCRDFRLPFDLMVGVNRNVYR